MKCQRKQEVHNLHLFHLLHKQREVEHRDTKVQLMLLKQRWERMEMKTAFGSQAKKPDCQRERSEQSERAQEKGPPFFCCYLPLNQCPERSSWALLPAHSARRAARREISHQLLRKTQELGEKPGPGESSTANETKNEWEFLFPSLLISVFMESNTSPGPLPLCGGAIYENREPPDWFWVGEWSSSAMVHVALWEHTGTSWERFPTPFLQNSSIPTFLSHDRAGQEGPHLNVSLEIPHLCKCSKAASPHPVSCIVTSEGLEHPPSLILSPRSVVWKSIWYQLHSSDMKY